jgi:hypothetical protein
MDSSACSPPANVVNAVFQFESIAIGTPKYFDFSAAIGGFAHVICAQTVLRANALAGAKLQKTIICSERINSRL